MTNQIKKIFMINDRIKVLEEEKNKLSSSIKDQERLNDINNIIKALNEYLLTID